MEEKKETNGKWKPREGGKGAILKNENYLKCNSGANEKIKVPH